MRTQLDELRRLAATTDNPSLRAQYNAEIARLEGNLDPFEISGKDAWAVHQIVDAIQATRQPATAPRLTLAHVITLFAVMVVVFLTLMQPDLPHLDSQGVVLLGIWWLAWDWTRRHP